MTRTISPPRSDLNSLRQPLEEGEWRVLEFFDAHLPEGWEIYIQPHLNGLRPDFVLLHPHVGIAVFEVKNWDLEAIDRWVEARNDKAPLLKGRKDDKEFSLQSDNPVEKVFRYKQEIQDLYCPRIDQRSGLAVVTAGIIFPSADDEKVLQLLKPCLEYRNMVEWSQYNPISGRKALNNGDISRVFPESKRRQSKYMTPDLAADLRLWLVEPDAPRTQRTPLELDETQRKLATSRTKSGYRRITGPAGSGKSVVLAARAAKLISEGKEVLVIAFNITLLNYLADEAVRNYPPARRAATWLNFHHWCKRVCEDADYSEEYRALWKNDEGFPDNELCRLVGSIIDRDKEGLVQRYDAVLVDEGQDFKPSWWALLRKVCRPGGELLLAADATQDVYGTASSWTDGAMKGAGFAGDWTRLNVSYRLPSGLIDFVREFGRRFLPHNNVDLPPTRQLELNINVCLRWVQVVPGQAAATAVDEVWGLMKSHGPDGLSVSDITILVDSQELGQSVVSLVGERGTRCVNTFEKDKRQRRRKKLAFFMGDARIKATTLHSFKGWETRALLICVEHAQDQRAMALLYAGLTRLKQHPLGSFLTVVCGEPRLAEYGKSWPDFVLQERPNNNFEGTVHKRRCARQVFL
jgi:hypothetical protein